MVPWGRCRRCAFFSALSPWRGARWFWRPEVLLPANRFLVAEAREPFEPRGGTGGADVDHEDGMPAAVRAEIGVHAGGVGVGPGGGCRGLGLVAVAHVPGEALASVGGAHVKDAQRLGIGGGPRPFRQVP